MKSIRINTTDPKKIGFNITKEEFTVIMPTILKDSVFKNCEELNLEGLSSFLNILESHAKKEESIDNTKYDSDKLKSILGFIELYQDYVNNGDYFIFNKYDSNNGRINWNKVFKKTPTLINCDYFYYPIDEYTNYFKNIDDTYIQIYYYCLNKSLELLGFDPIFETFIDSGNMNLEVVLNKRYSLFTDRDLKINHILLKILDSEAIAEDKIETSYHNSFANIFESMVESFLENEIKDKEENQLYIDNKKAIAHTHVKEHKEKGALKIDHFIKYKNSHFFILDSKFMIETKSNDVYKQLVYYSIFSIIKNTINDDNNFYNIFIKPQQENNTPNMDEFINNFFSIYPNLNENNDKIKDNKSAIMAEFKKVYGTLHTLEINLSQLWNYSVGVIKQKELTNFKDDVEQYLNKLIIKKIT